MDWHAARGSHFTSSTTETCLTSRASAESCLPERWEWFTACPLSPLLLLPFVWCSSSDRTSHMWWCNLTSRNVWAGCGWHWPCQPALHTYAWFCLFILRPLPPLFALSAAMPLHCQRSRCCAGVRTDKHRPGCEQSLIHPSCWSSAQASRDWSHFCPTQPSTHLLPG